MLGSCGWLRGGGRLTLGLALTLAALAGGPAVSAQSSGQAPAPVPNPHWSATGCTQCHQSGTPAASEFTPAQVEELCTACHDGKRVLKFIHPSLRPIHGEQFKRPGDWPLVDGLVGCLTCHDVQAACQENLRRPARNPVFLRGYDGSDLAGFCNNCHVRAEVRRFNPHDMIAADGGFKPEKCTYCHLGVPQSGSGAEPDPQAVGLRYDGVTLCMGCHQRHVDYFEPGHVGRRVTADRKAHMAAAEQAAAQGRREEGVGQPRRLPLQGGEVVVCWTCHNPHARGVFAPGTVQAHGGFEPGGKARNLGLRYGPSEICRGCHDN